MKPFLKVISLHQNQPALLKRARAGNREAQNMIYSRYAPVMLSLCRSYIRDAQYAEDAMVTGFFKVFKNLHSYKGEGSFEGWMRKIMVRQCIDHLRKKQPEQFLDLQETEVPGLVTGGDVPESLEVNDLQQLIDEMPDGYRTVFLMYAVEGYSHKEIAFQLSVSENTSKSQLYKARKLLQQKLARIKETAYEVRRV